MSNVSRSCSPILFAPLEFQVDAICVGAFSPKEEKGCEVCFAALPFANADWCPVLSAAASGAYGTYSLPSTCGGLEEMIS